MKFFDPYIHSDARTDDDLENLVYFGTESVISCANAPQRFERADQLLGYLDWLLTEEANRLTSFGLEARFALGVHPRAAPSRAFYELWRELPELLAEPSVVALGELGVTEGSSREYGLLEHQLRLAVQLNMPCIVRIPTSNAAPVLRQTRACVGRAGVDPARVLLTNLDPARPGVLDEVQDYKLALRLDADLVRSEEWPSLRAALDRRQVLLTAALTAGPADVLAVNRATIALGDLGEEPSLIEQWAYGNAMELFIR